MKNTYHYVPYHITFFALLFLVSLGEATALFAQTEWPFENAVQNYAYQAIDNPPVPGCTLFVGSSSFALWGKKLEDTFADYEAVNRGFGGSKFSDNLRAMNSIHLPASPSRVVIFCGTNDIAGGDDAETVFRNFKYYIARFWNEHPAAEIYFVSPTHAPVREKFWKTGDELFAKVEELSKKVYGLFCIDIRPAMLGEDGKVREDLFVQDRLHLNADGYAIWEKVFKEVLDKQDKERQPRRNIGKENTIELQYSDDEVRFLKELYEGRKSAGLFDDLRFAEQGIVIKDYSQPMKKLSVVFIGGLITTGIGLTEKEEPWVRSVSHLKELGCEELSITIRGVGEATTVDIAPHDWPKRDMKKNFIFQQRIIGDLGARYGSWAKSEYELVFSIMLGTSDSAVKGANGAPVSPENYRQNMKKIVDALLMEYPTAKIVIHRPIWYSPTTHNNSVYLLEGQLRLRAYFPEIEALVDCYSRTSAKGHVFLGDVDAFQYFRTHAEEVFTVRQGKTGVPYMMHPNKKGADALGRFWAAAIWRTVR